MKNCFGDLQQGLFVRRIREVLRQNNVQNLDVLRERVLRIDWTGARFLQSLMVVTDDPATWLPLNVYVRRIFRRLAKWVSLPSAVRRTVLETNLGNRKCQLVNQSFNSQSLDFKAINQSINQGVNQSSLTRLQINPSIQHSFIQTIKQHIQSLDDQSINQSMSHSVDATI